MIIQKCLFITWYFVIIGLFLLFSYITGRRLVDIMRLPFFSIWEEISFSIALGMGTLSYMIFFIGLAGFLNHYVVSAIILLIIILNYRSGIDLIRKCKGYCVVFRLRWLFITAVVLFLSLPIFLMSLYPPTAWDSTSYHLAAVKSYLKAEQIGSTPYLRYAVSPQLTAMLFSFMMIYFNDISAHLVSFSMMLVTAIILYSFCERYYSKCTGMWAMAIFLSNPIVLWLGTVAYVDIGLVLFVSVSISALVNWFTSKNTSWLVMAAISAGFSAGVKYSALLFIVVVSAWILYLSYSEQRYKQFWLFVIITIAVAAPWYIYNFYFTGNPLWPFFPNIFGYRIWNNIDLQGQTESILYAYYWNERQDTASFSSFLKLPWDMIFHSEFFGPDIPNPLSKTLIMFVPLVIVACFKDLITRILVALIIVFTTLWFYTTQTLRYLIPVLPLFCIVAAASVEMFFIRLFYLKRLMSKPMMALTVVISLILPGWLFALKTINNNRFPAVTETEKVKHLSQRLHSYEAYGFLNNIAGNKYTIYALFDENMAYFANGRFMGDCFGPARFSRIRDKIEDEDTLYKELVSLGAGYLLINLDRLEKEMQEGWLLWKHIYPIFGRGNVLLFKISDKVMCQQRGSELLANASFEKINNNYPEGWTRIGLPVVNTSGKESADGMIGIKVNSNNYFVQRVNVKQGMLYILTHKTRSNGINNKTRLQVNWLDQNGKQIKMDIAVINSSDIWKSHSMVITSPEIAKFADVYACVHEGSEVWFDAFSFQCLTYIPYLMRETN